MAAGQVSDTTYLAERITVSVDASYDDFRRRYEAAVPPYDAEAFAELARRRADWSEVLDLVNRCAPYGFLIYGSIDMSPMMSLAGDPAPCVQYLMGNHTLAERMFRYDPAAMMYAPLRTVISAALTGNAQFSIERPSSVFSSFGNEEIAAVGVELDEKVAGLLMHLDAPVPPALLGG